MMCIGDDTIIQVWVVTTLEDVHLYSVLIFYLNGLYNFIIMSILQIKTHLACLFKKIEMTASTLIPSEGIPL